MRANLASGRVGHARAAEGGAATGAELGAVDRPEIERRHRRAVFRPRGDDCAGPAEPALRYDRPVPPTRVDRLHGARFRVTIFPALDFARSGDRQADVRAAMTEVNRCLEQWIRERPGQWFWLHRRWPES